MFDHLPIHLRKSAIIEAPFEIPIECKQEPCVVGVDEAGRGPVMGPMVYSVLFYPKSRAEIIKDSKFADSKTLSEEEREMIYSDFICKDFSRVGSFVAKALTPRFISHSMHRKQKYNLNEISHDTVIELLNHLIKAKVQVSEVYVDTVGPPEKYQAKLESFFPGIKITVSKKADSLFPSGD